MKLAKAVGRSILLRSKAASFRRINLLNPHMCRSFSIGTLRNTLSFAPAKDGASTYKMENTKKQNK